MAKIIRAPLAAFDNDGIVTLKDLELHHGCAVMRAGGGWETFLEGNDLGMPRKHALLSNVNEGIERAQYYIEIEFGYDQCIVLVLEAENNTGVVLVASPDSRFVKRVIAAQALRELDNFGQYQYLKRVLKDEEITKKMGLDGEEAIRSAMDYLWVRLTTEERARTRVEP